VIGGDMDVKIFIYRNGQGVITSRELTIISDTPDYLCGFCGRNYRTFRKDRILEFIDNSNQIDERLSYHIKDNPEPTPRRVTGNIKGDLEICFTGFTKKDRDRLESLAKSENLFVRKSVTRKLFFLCCGYNSGPSKIEQSLEQGVTIIGEDQFLKFLKTGEIPEEQ
jgi:NAD-dependent DNA ligase